MASLALMAGVAGAAPSAPTISSVYQSSTPMFVGRAAPNSRVEIDRVENGSYIPVNSAQAAGDGAWTIHWAGAPLTSGTYLFSAVASDSTGTSAYSMTETVTVGAEGSPPTPMPSPPGSDVTPPTLLQWFSYGVTSSAPSLAYFRVDFSEAVTGLDPSDVSVSVSGGVTEAHVSDIAPDITSASYQITVSFVGSNGTVSISIPGGAGANIRDVSGNLFTYGGAGTYYAVPVQADDNGTAPVITGPSSIDVVHNIDPSDLYSPKYSFTIQATGRPTSYSTTGLPGQSVQFSSTTGYAFGGGVSPGIYHVSLSATNAYGTGTGSLTIKVHGYLTGWGNDHGTFHPGDQITITYQFNTRVTMTGDPTVLLSVGGAQRHATYLSGNGTTTVVFGYRFAASDPAGEVRPFVAPDNGGFIDENGLTATASIFLKYYDPAASFDPTVAIAAPAPASAPPASSTTSSPPATGASSSPQTITSGSGAASRLVNISSRLRVSGDDAEGASIAGFVVKGDSPKPILIRGVGPSLASFGVAGPLVGPQLKLFDANGAVLATNAGWNNDAQIAAASATVGAFPLGLGSKDAAVLVSLAPGSYTAQVQSSTGGTALIEVYDATATASSTKHLVNISIRGNVGGGDDVLIGGFVVSGDQPKRILIRGIGPGLTAFGVAGALNDPLLTVYDSKQGVVARNDNWGTPQPLDASQSLGTAADIAAADTAAGAFALTPGSADAALVLTLNPGAYSAVVAGANGAKGNAMVEVYEVSP